MNKAILFIFFLALAGCSRTLPSKVLKPVQPQVEVEKPILQVSPPLNINFTSDSSTIASGRKAIFNRIQSKRTSPATYEVLKIEDDSLVQYIKQQLELEKKFKRDFPFKAMASLGVKEVENIYNRHSVGDPLAMGEMISIIESDSILAIVDLYEQIRYADSLDILKENRHFIDHPTLQKNIVESLKHKELQAFAIPLILLLQREDRVPILENLLQSGKSCCAQDILFQLSMEASSIVALDYISKNIATAERKYPYEENLKLYSHRAKSEMVKKEAALVVIEYYSSLLSSHPDALKNKFSYGDFGFTDHTLLARAIQNGDERIVPFLLKYKSSTIADEKKIPNVNFKLWRLGEKVTSEEFSSFFSNQTIMLQIFYEQIEQTEFLKRPDLYEIAFNGILGWDDNSVIGYQASQRALGAITLYFKDVEKEEFKTKLKKALNGVEHSQDEFYLSTIKVATTKILELHQVANESQTDILDYLEEIHFLSPEERETTEEKLLNAENIPLASNYSKIGSVLNKTDKLFYAFQRFNLSLEYLEKSTVDPLKNFQILSYYGPYVYSDGSSTIKMLDFLILFNNQIYVLNTDNSQSTDYSKQKFKIINLVNPILRDQQIQDSLIPFGSHVHFYGKETPIEKMTEKYELHFSSFNH